MIGQKKVLPEREKLGKRGHHRVVLIPVDRREVVQHQLKDRMAENHAGVLLDVLRGDGQQKLGAVVLVRVVDPQPALDPIEGYDLSGGFGDDDQAHGLVPLDPGTAGATRRYSRLGFAGGSLVNAASVGSGFAGVLAGAGAGDGGATRFHWPVATSMAASSSATSVS